eukprot:Em0244g6a
MASRHNRLQDVFLESWQGVVLGMKNVVLDLLMLWSLTGCFGSADNDHLQHAVVVFNSRSSIPNTITVESALASPISQKVLSGLLAFSSPGPSIGLDLRLEHMSTRRGGWSWTLQVVLHAHSVPILPLILWSPCHGLQALGRWGHTPQSLLDEVFDLCPHVHLSVRFEKGHGLTRDLDHTRLLRASLLDETEANLHHYHPSTLPFWSAVVAKILGQLNLALIRSIARAFLVTSLISRGNLMAIDKSKSSCAFDIRPIAVNACALLRKAAKFFQPLFPAL